tara:strand:- start:3660 stop:4550 length:891 start_codon:yes stop_codon:yes gene_type:complete
LVDTLQSLGDWRRDAARQLAAVDSASAEAEARWLVEHVLALTTTQLILAEPKALTRAPRQQLDAALARRLAGEPLAQITGRADFGPLALRITPDVLVPRADTEALVTRALAQGNASAPLRVLDLGTGSGAIALMIAHARPVWQITATDRSPAALACAQDNARSLGAANVVFKAADWFDGLAGESFDLIVANPPYIAADDPHLAALTHEPRQALVAADDGLADLAAIISGAPAHLSPGASLFLEHGHTQGPAVAARLVEAGFHDVATTPDAAGRDRVTGGVLPTQAEISSGVKSRSA